MAAWTWTPSTSPFVAEDDEVARLLLERTLDASKEGSPVEVTVTGPDSGPAAGSADGPAACPAHALLREFGFEGREDRLRMELGEASPLRRSGLHHYGATPYLAT